MNTKGSNFNSTPPDKNLNEFPSKTYKLKDFELKVFQGEKTIIFHSSEIKDLTGTLFKAELTLEELYDLSDLFRSFVSIEKLFTDFFKELEESEILIKKEENKIILTIIVALVKKKYDPQIILIPEEPKIENVVAKLCDKVKEIDSLNKIIQDQKIIIEKQQKEFNDFRNYAEDKIKELEASIKKESETLKYNIEYNNLVHINSDEAIKFKESLIEFNKKINSCILRYNELHLIEEGVLKKLNKRIKKFTLLFRASKHGFRSQDFHKRCDNKSNTVTLIKTTNGRRFGGFTDAQWDQSNNYKSGSNGFIFSLDDKAIYYNKNGSYNIYCSSGNGPYFGSGDFYLSDNCDSSPSGESSGNSYQTYSKNYALSGYSNFFVKNYEVFQLEFE